MSPYWGCGVVRGLWAGQQNLLEGGEPRRAAWGSCQVRAELPGPESRGWRQQPRIRLESRRLDLGLDKRARTVYLKPKGALRGLPRARNQGRDQKSRAGPAPEVRDGARREGRGQRTGPRLGTPTGHECLGQDPSLPGIWDADGVQRPPLTRAPPPPRRPLSPPKTPLGSQSVPAEPFFHRPVYLPSCICCLRIPLILPLHRLPPLSHPIQS